MFKDNRKKYKITLNKRGEESFQFFFEKELNIYWCLCRAPGYKKIIKKVDEGELFDSYKEWKAYIQDKYSNQNEEGLEEFSRYLNQRLRNLRPGRQANELYIPVALALIVEKFTEVLLASTGIVSLFEEMKIRRNKPRSSTMSTLYSYLIPVLYFAVTVLLSYNGMSIYLVYLLGIIVILLSSVPYLINIKKKVANLFLELEMVN